MATSKPDANRIRAAGDRAVEAMRRASLGPGEILGETSPLIFSRRPAPHMPEYLHPDFPDRERARLLAQIERDLPGRQTPASLPWGPSMGEMRIILSVDCAQGRDDPSGPRGQARFDWGDLDGVVLTLGNFQKPLTRRRRRRLRGGKTQPTTPRPTFRAWIPDRPMVIARGAAQVRGTA